MLFSHRDLVPRLRLGTKSLGALKACTNLYLVDKEKRTSKLKPSARFKEQKFGFYSVIISRHIQGAAVVEGEALSWCVEQSLWVRTPVCHLNLEIVKPSEQPNPTSLSTLCTLLSPTESDGNVGFVQNNTIFYCIGYFYVESHLSPNKVS